MKQRLVRDIMINNPPSVYLGTELNQVVDKLLENNLLGMPVIDSEKRVVGFVSEQNCIRSLLVNSYHSEGSTFVEDIMFEEALTVSPTDSIVDLAKRMTLNKPKIYPVVENGKLVGLVSRSSVIRVLRNSQRVYAVAA